MKRGIKHWFTKTLVKICEVSGGFACMTCQVWYVARHFLYIYAMFYIFMPCFMSILIHIVLLFIYAAPRFSFLLYCLLSFIHWSDINTIDVCCIKICQQFHFFYHLYNQKLSSPAVACGQSALHDLHFRGITTRSGIHIIHFFIIFNPVVS